MQFRATAPGRRRPFQPSVFPCSFFSSRLPFFHGDDRIIDKHYNPGRSGGKPRRRFRGELMKEYVMGNGAIALGALAAFLIIFFRRKNRKIK